MNSNQKRNKAIGIVVAAFVLISICSAVFSALVLYVRYDESQREAQMASGNFSGEISDIVPILKNGSTISVSIALRVDGADSEIVVLSPEFASLTKYTVLDLTGCQKNPAGFWENCQVDIR